MNKKAISNAIVVDGNALIYKLYFALAWRKDESINIVPQMLELLKNSLEKLLNKKEYKYAVVAFDSSKVTFRSEKLKEYKAQRDPMPQDLLNNLFNIREIFKKKGFAVVMSPKLYEADDVIGTLSNKFSLIEVKTDIFTTDKDLLQLVNYWTTVNILKTGVSKICIYNHNNFQKLTSGLLPYQIPFLKALAGDASDNYKGLPGIGIKTSELLIKEYKNKKNLYFSLEKLSPKTKAVLIENEKQLDLLLEIAKIVQELEIGNDVNDFLKTSSNL